MGSVLGMVLLLCWLLKFVRQVSLVMVFVGQGEGLLKYFVVVDVVVQDQGQLCQLVGGFVVVQVCLGGDEFGVEGVGFVVEIWGYG